MWWEFNKEPYLAGHRPEQQVLPVSGSDDFYLGTRRQPLRLDLLSPTDADLSDKIVPTLAKMLARESNRDIQSACLVALGKVGLDGAGVELEKVLSDLIRRDNQEVRETAVLALGIAGREKALPLLIALVRDTPEGRKLSDRREVDDRTRSFAAYSLGLLARRSDDGDVKQQVHDALWPLLDDKALRDRDLRMAAVTGLGLLRADPQQGAHKRLAWQCIEELLDWYGRDQGRGDELLQAHASIAIARLLGRGSSPLHQRCKELFASELEASKRRANPILQSACVALGMLAVPQEEHADDAAFSQLLQRYYSRGTDRQARYFAAISLGRIGGASNREWLLGALTRANSATEKPWVAMALGLVGHAARVESGVDRTVAQVLLDELSDCNNYDTRAALAVAVGLTGWEGAVPVVLRMLGDNEREERQAGYYCVSLALLGDRAASVEVASVLERSLRRPFLLQQAAIALGRLGDREAAPQLLAMMKENDSAAVLAALAVAIGEIGDRRAIDPLIEMTGDDQLTKLARAFVAAALGAIGDKDPMPWSVPISKDSNYAASVDTLTNGATGILDIL
jgi:HEAT repeat protein